MDDADLGRMLGRNVAVASGKGGVGKTSTAVNVAAAAAGMGLAVLVVDVDGQGSTAEDFGAHARPGSPAATGNDHGRGFLGALLDGSEPPVVAARKGIDWVPGGNYLNVLNGAAGPARHGDLRAAARSCLAGLSARYDLVLVDCPPGNSVLQEIGLAVSGHVLVPVGADTASSVAALLNIGPQVRQVREQCNPGLRWLGFFEWGVDVTATRVARILRARLDGVDKVPRLEDQEGRITVRWSRAVAQACRERGLTVAELAAELAKSRAETAAALAGDYARLTRAVIGAIIQQEG